MSQDIRCPHCRRELFAADALTEPFPCPFCGDLVTPPRFSPEQAARQQLALQRSTPRLFSEATSPGTRERRMPSLFGDARPSRPRGAAQAAPRPPSAAFSSEPSRVAPGEEQACPRCETSLYVPPDSLDFPCPRCGEALTVEGAANHEPLFELPCPNCRRALSVPRPARQESFTCPHCEQPLLLYCVDSYRESAPRLALPPCACGGVLRMERMLAARDPLQGASAILGLHAASIRELLMKGGAPSDDTCNGGARLCRCERCGTRAEFPI